VRFDLTRRQFLKCLGVFVGGMVAPGILSGSLKKFSSDYPGTYMNAYSDYGDGDTVINSLHRNAKENLPHGVPYEIWDFNGGIWVHKPYMWSKKNKTRFMKVTGRYFT